MSQAEFKKRLKMLMNKPENQVCSDCPERQPRWASLIVPPPGSPPGSLPFGAFCCLECSGSHRRLGVHISFVRSITLDSWKEKEVLAMENGGNAKVNAVFEAHLNNPAAKPSTGASGSVRERYIRDKYERRKYYDPSVLQNYGQEVSSDSSSSSSSGPSPTRQSVRAPSEAARLRAQARKRSNPKIPKVSAATSSSMSKSRSGPVPPPVTTAVDLLDFSAPIAGANSGPPLQPPSAAPSPTLDMFKNMQDMSVSGSNVSGGGSGSGGEQFYHQSSSSSVTRSATMPVRAGNNLAPQMDSKKMTSDDILAMFHSPSNPQQQQMQPSSTFGNFGANSPNNSMHNMNMNMNNQMMNNNNSIMHSNMGNINMMNNNMNMNSGMMRASSFPMQHRQQQGQQQRNMMSGMQNNGMGMQNNGMGMQGQGQANFNNNMVPMGGAPSNMNMMGGNGMVQSGMNQSFQGNQNNMSMGTGSMGGTNNNIDKRNGGQGQQGFGNVMGGSASQQSNQFASFGSFH